MESIANFYAGKSILITGSTGFMGKVLVEKILRSCPDIDKIYVLIRPKNGESAKTRWEKVTQDILFNILKEQAPNSLDKVITVEGDIIFNNLGLNPDSLKSLQEISIIFHTAATVRFDESLSSSLKMNVCGTKHLIDFAKTLKDLKVFMHVSTTFCASSTEMFQEKVYPPLADWKKMIEYLDSGDVTCMDVLKHKIIHPMPNVYTFTKSLAEQVVNEAKEFFPIIIFRPSIVVSTLKEPIRGWAENFNGPIGVSVACGKGLMRQFVCVDQIAPIVPVDHAIKAMLISAWKMDYDAIHDGDAKISVYNAKNSNFTTPLMQSIDIALRLLKKSPFKEQVWYPSPTIESNFTIYRLKAVYKHFLFALFIDFFLAMFTNKKIRTLKLHIKIQNGINELKNFTMKAYEVNNENYLSLNDIIPKKELNDFNFIEEFNMEQYIGESLRIMKLKHFNDPPDNIPEARKQLNRLYWIDFIANIIKNVTFLIILYKLFPTFGWF